MGRFDLVGLVLQVWFDRSCLAGFVCVACGNTCRASWIVKYVHSLNCDDHFATKPDFRGNSSKKLLQVYILFFF